MIASPARIVGGVRVGGITPLGQWGVPSGFVKHPVAGLVAVDANGVAGDVQADRRVHGAPDKAVYAYPASGYPIWRAAVPHHADRLVDGAMGENMIVDGWSDADVAIGDTVRAGTAVLQVTEPRTPCYKLGLRFGDPSLLRTFGELAISGWYYRVLKAGTIGAGDVLTCIARPNPDWTVARFFAVITGGSVGDNDLVAIAALDGISEGWRLKALRLLARRGAA